MSAVFVQSAWKGFAGVGQNVVPIVCLAGAGVSAWQRKVRKRLVDDAAQGQASDALDGMSWREFEILVGEGVDVVRDLYGVMSARGATGGFVVTSGRFMDEAIGFANGRNVTLVDGPKLRGLLQQAKAGAGSSIPASSATPLPAQAKAAPAQSPTCPSCSKPMVRRTAKRGAIAGGEFWGRTGYPACRGTRPIG